LVQAGALPPDAEPLTPPTEPLGCPPLAVPEELVGPGIELVPPLPLTADELELVPATAGEPALEGRPSNEPPSQATTKSAETSIVELTQNVRRFMTE
jgi:hypothetical protein